MNIFCFDSSTFFIPKIPKLLGPVGLKNELSPSILAFQNVLCGMF